MSLIWGVPYLMIRVAVRDLDPATLVFFRTAIGTVLLLPLAVRQREIAPLKPYWKPVLAYTVIEIGIPWLLLSTAETRISSSLSGLLIAAVPLVGVVLALATGTRGSFGPVQIAGLLVGLGGVAALAGLDIGSAQVGSLLAIAVVVVCYATGPWILSRYLADAPRLGVVVASLAITAIAYAPAAAVEMPSHLPSAEVVAAVVGLGVVCTALAFPIFFDLIGEVGPVRATVITYVNPAVALLFGVTLLNEPFTAGTALGFVLILAGSYFATRPATGKRSPVPVPAPAPVPVADAPPGGARADVTTSPS
jgi:drug/metabolite transporter (DMT)-like permease